MVPLPRINPMLNPNQNAALSVASAQSAGGVPSQFSNLVGAQLPQTLYGVASQPAFNTPAMNPMLSGSNLLSGPMGYMPAAGFSQNPLAGVVSNGAFSTNQSYPASSYTPASIASLNGTPSGPGTPAPTANGSLGYLTNATIESSMQGPLGAAPLPGLAPAAGPPSAQPQATPPLYAPPVAAASPMQRNAPGAAGGQAGGGGGNQAAINAYMTSGGYGSPMPGPSGNYGSSYNPVGYNSSIGANWTSPNFNPVSGGSIYSYSYNPQSGQGQYINSAGNTISYSSF